MNHIPTAIRAERMITVLIKPIPFLFYYKILKQKTGKMENSYNNHKNNFITVLVKSSKQDRSEGYPGAIFQNYEM